MKCIKESELAQTLGLRRFDLIEIRNKRLIKRTDWKRYKGQGRHILLTESGVKKICAHLKVPMETFLEKWETLVRSDAAISYRKGGDDPCHSIKEVDTLPNSDGTTGLITSGSSSPGPVQPATGAANGNAIMTVVRLFPNPYILEARDNQGWIYRVKVHSSLNYLPGDKLKAIPDETVPTGMLRQVGPAPRRKGDKSYVHLL